MGYFEISNRVSKGGKRKIKLSLLEIHTDEDGVNKNGLHWVEKYVVNAVNAEPTFNIPLCVEFIDDEKEIPLGHGYTSIDSTENQPLFENSEVVGSVYKAYPTTVEIDGEEKRILCGEGFIYQQRYPKFTNWLVKNVKNSKVMSSIEIMGTPENNNVIKYENDIISAEKRTPCEFLFSGSALLSIEPADDSAMVLQMNSLDTNKSNDNKQESEDETMDEKTINLICDSVKNAVSETNSKNSEYEAQIAELNQTITEKDAKIAELNASVAEVQAALDAVRAEIEQKSNELDGAWEEKRVLEIALGEAKAKERLGELSSAIANFTEEQKDFAKDEIEAFKADPTNVEINTVLDAIYRGIGKQSLEKKNEKTTVVETNSADIYGEVFTPQAKADDSTEGSIY